MKLIPSKCIFRINRDIRFSKNKKPYKTNFGAILSNKSKSKIHNQAAYYLHIESGNSFLGGGAYIPHMTWLGEIRDRIILKPKEFKKIINNKNFTDNFTLEGTKLKTAPRGYDKDHPEIELLRHKSFLGLHKLSDKQVLSKNFLKHCAKTFKELKPFNDFLNTPKCKQ